MTHPISLREIQKWMQNALVQPNAVQNTEIDTYMAASNRLSASERLAIYQRSYVTRLYHCLAEQFPASRHALGARLFNNFARVYLAQKPSDSYTLYELGRRFPLFLQATRPDKDQPKDRQETWVNFMIDLATYERALFVLFDAPGHEGKPWPTPDTPDEHLVLQPCFHLAAYRFPVANYYHSVSDQSEPELPPSAESYVAISRYNYFTSSFPITRPHYQFLKALQKTQSVADSLNYVAERLKVSNENVRASWKENIRNQWIANHFFVDRNTLNGD